MTRAELNANVGPSASGIEPSTEELWQDVLARWDDERTHHALLETCRRRERLGEAARLYRSLLEDGASAYRVDHERRSQIQRRLNAVGAVASLSFQPTDEEPSDFGRRARVRLFMFAALIMLAALIWALLR